MKNIIYDVTDYADWFIKHTTGRKFSNRRITLESVERFDKCNPINLFLEVDNYTLAEYSYVICQIVDKISTIDSKDIPFTRYFANNNRGWHFSNLGYLRNFMRQVHPNDFGGEFKSPIIKYHCETYIKPKSTRFYGLLTTDLPREPYDNIYAKLRYI